MAEEASHLDGNYAAFGKVIEGIDVVEAINSVETNSNDKPLKDVVIESITVDTKGIDYKEPKKHNNNFSLNAMMTKINDIISRNCVICVNNLY